MSHYAVGIITKNGSESEIETLLAPYDENIKTAPRIAKTKAQIIESAKESKKILQQRMEEEENYELTSFNKELLACETDEDYYKYYRGEDENYDSEGNELTTYNENSKWDWWTIGGRWSGHLKLKENAELNDDEYEDSARIKNIDFSPNEETKEYYKRFWEVVVEGKEETEEEKEDHGFAFCYKKEYYLERYSSKEEFADRMSAWSVYAVVTPNGLWNAPGEMGWFGVSTETADEERDWDEHFKERFIDPYQDYYLTIVDCHI